MCAVRHLFAGATPIHDDERGAMRIERNWAMDPDLDLHARRTLRGDGQSRAEQSDEFTVIKNLPL